MPETFHFLQPGWFWLLIPLALLIWLLRQTMDQSSAWQKICDARLLPFLLDSQPSRHSSIPTVLLAAGSVLTVIALADPVWQQQEQPLFRNEAARVIVLDLSNSMLSPDLKPSRITRARYKVADILKQDLDGQTGLVVFAGDAFAVAPLTYDVDTILALLAPLQPALMPAQGSRLDLGLLKAADLMKQAGLQRGDILLLTDGFESQQALDTAAQVSREGYRVSVLAVGTAAGAPIPAGRGRFLRDAQGQVVIPALDQSGLQQLAAAGGGHYTLISGGNTDLAYLLSSMTPEADGQADQSGPTTETWRSNGAWLAMLLLPLAALAFRRGWLLTIVLLVGGGMSTPQPAMALGWDDIWLRADQQAERALQAGDPAQAAQLARDPDLRGTAAYQAGEYEAALQSFSQGAGIDADYNQGNALAQMQRYEEAIVAYDRALAQQADMQDALHNKAEVEKLLQQQEQQEQQQGENDQQDQQQSDAGESDDARQGQQGEQSDKSDEQQQSAQGADAQANDGSEPEQSDNASQQDQQQQAEADEQQETSENTGQDKNEAMQQTAMTEADPLDSEEQRAAEQWLRRIPDDPAGLLRRKFQYQYKQRAAQTGTGGSQQW